MKTNIKVYSNLNLINHDNGQAKQITIYVKNGVIDKISYSPPENGIDFIIRRENPQIIHKEEINADKGEYKYQLQDFH